MNLETFYDYCLQKKGVEPTFPFGDQTLVLKVMGKMFAAAGLDNERFEVNLKCDPEWALELREQYADVRPGYHMNKTHWNTVHFEGELEDRLLYQMIDHSYDLVVQSLPRKVKAELEKL